MVPMHRFSARNIPFEPFLLILLWLQSNAAGDVVDSQHWSEWSVWSSCSAHCEYGISSRTRQCLPRDSLVSNFNSSSSNSLQVNSTACSGAYSQIKVCNLKACPPDQASPHQRSCSLYNSRMFSGKQYVWEPFIHPNGACKMACRAKGKHFYANLPDKAEDGTPCKLGTSEAVCVNGVCKLVGCDGIVESGAVKDTCSVCGGDSSSCQTISGIFTSTALKSGLNFVISIPAGSTNINITELQVSRNLLVLQTETGQTIINEDTSNPTSVIVHSAGTVFNYNAKSPSNPKETIFSAGPTNMTVNLKFLMRGSNPAIMYTFSVPKEVSDAVIQQIRHHSQPVELPPEPNADRHSQHEALDAEDNTLLSQNNLTPNPSYTESPNSHALLELAHQRSFDSDKQTPDQETPAVGNSYEKTSSPSIYELTPATSGRSGSGFKKDSDGDSASDIIMASPESVWNADDLSMDRTSQSATATQDVPGSQTLDSNNNWNIARSTESSAAHSNMEKKDDHLHHVKATIDQRKLYPQPTIAMGDVLDEDINNSYNNDNNGEEINNNNTLSRDSSNTFSSSAKERTRNAMDEYKTRLNDESPYSPENEITRKLTNAERNPLNSAGAPNKTMHSNNDSGNTEYDKKQNSQISNMAKDKIDGSESSNSDILEARDLGDVTRNETSKSLQFSNMDDISLVSSKDSVLSTNIHSHSSIIDTQGMSRDVGYQESVKKDESLKSHKNLSRYKIPRYSQSFTFAERYKDQPNKDSHRSRARQHTRRRHSHLRSTSQNTTDHHNYLGTHQKTQYETDSSDNQSAFEQNRVRNTERLPTLDSGTGYLYTFQGRDENTDRGNSVSEFGSFSHADTSTQDGASESHQSDRDDEADREKRLRDRQILVEERRRRMEEQRLRYNERLREYQEMLRQRQTEIDQSRRRSSNAVGTPRAANSRTSDESSSPRRQHQYETNPSLSSRDEKGSRSSVVGIKTPLQPPDRTDSDIWSQSKGPSGSSVGNSNTFSNTNSRSVGSDPSSDALRQEQFERRRGYNQQTDSSTRRHTELQPSKKDEASGSERIINRNQGTYNNDRLPSRVTSSGQTNPPYVPLVREPPRQEYPEYFDGGNSNSYSSQSIPRVQQSGPRYIPGSPSGTAVLSALTGPEVALGGASNKIYSDTNISPSRQPRLPNQFGSGDPLINQISLDTLGTVQNTLGTIYEWRISGLTECTHTCGGGVQQTVVVCVDTLTQAVVTGDNCRYTAKPKLLAVPCNTRPCSAEWTPGPWSSCSVSCGRGEQTRTVTCQARVSPTLNLTMPSSTCESQERLPNRQMCNNNPCSSWRVGTWSNCSTPCGDGQKTRDVQCVDLESNVLSDNACLEFRPDSEERCNLGECGKGWFFTEWPTECPVECGTGEVTRQVFCADDTGSALPESRCDTNQRPAVSQRCRVNRPCGGLWFTGQWSACHGKCGSGTRRRDVLCIKELPGVVHAVVDGENCEGSDKPSETEPCQGSPCTSEWYMTSWSQCSQSCGTGYRTREVKCLDSDQKLQDDCSLDTRPRTRDACNTNECVDVEAEENVEDPTCVDKSAQCKVVKRARLCPYGYYKTMCCKSCSDDT